MNLLDRASQNRKASRLIDALALLFFVLFVVFPLFFIFTKIGKFQFSGEMQEAVAVSFAVASIVTAVDLIFGIPLAWLLAKKKFPLKGVVDAVVDLPLIIPTSALGLSIALFWGANGLGIFGAGLGLIVVLHIAFTFSYIVRTTQAAILEIDMDLAKAAGTLGATPLPAFRTIWMPLFRAGAVSGAILAFTRSLGETGATMIVAGALKTVPILTVYYKNSAPPDMDSAISLSAVFLALSALLFLLVQRKAHGGKFRLGAVHHAAEQRLGRLGGAADAAGVIFLFAVVLVPSFYFFRFMDFDFFAPQTIWAIAVSFALAGAATAVSLAFGLPLALIIAARGRIGRVVKLLVETSMMMPTVTIGLSLALFWAGFADEAIVLLFAHIAIVFPYFVSTISEVLSEMDRGIVEVARSLGAAPFYAFRTVVLPLIKPTVVAGLVVAFMRSVSETGGTLAVSKSISTVPLLIVNLNRAGQDAAAASAAALLLAISLALIVVLRKSQEKKW